MPQVTGITHSDSAALTGDAGAVEYELDTNPTLGDVRNDVLGELSVDIPGNSLALDWGAGSIGIDVGYTYKSPGSRLLRPERITGS